MVGKKLSSQAQLQMDVVTEVRRKWGRVYGLVEQYGNAKTGEDGYLSQIARASVDVSRILMNNGYGVMADTANQMAMLAKRGSSKQTKIRSMREFVVSLRQAMERAEKMIVDGEKEVSEGGGAGS
jgi:hypothetical protein